MATEFSTGKSIFILAIVAGCFAILWPSIFYPMLQGTNTSKTTTSNTQGKCCDVIFHNDFEAVRVMTDLCENILRTRPVQENHTYIIKQTEKINSAIVEACRDAIWEKCRVDITQILISKSGLNRSYKQLVEELRSHNSSVCLKQTFGVSFGLIGLPRTIRSWGLNRPKHLRQERPSHLRPDFLHPALREKGSAIPQSHIVPKLDGRPNLIPSMRPPMGGAGHVVPPPRGSNTMGIVMPMYTIGIVVFFLYTMMKLMFKKSDSNENYDSFTPDPDFHNAVFGETTYSPHEDVDDTTKLVVSAITGLVEEVNKQIRSDERLSSNHEMKDCELDETETIFNQKEEDREVEEASTGGTLENSGVLKVVGYEMTERSSTGGKYSRPSTPGSRSTTPVNRPITPQSLYLPNLLPPQSQLLVSQEETHPLTSEDNAEPIVLSAKVTLSLIGIPACEAGRSVESDANDLNKQNSIIKKTDGNSMYEDQRENDTTSNIAQKNVSNTNTENDARKVILDD